MSKYSEFQKWLMLQIRRISYRTRERNQAKAKARIKRGVYQCELCHGRFGVKQIQLDHKEPVLDPKVGFVSWDEYIKRLFVPADGYQVLCKKCHTEKSVAENKERRKEPEKKEIKLVRCKTCGWVHFEVSRDFALREVKSFNQYFYSLSEEEQESNYGGKPATMALYENCDSCGGSYKNFIKAKSSEIPKGSTVGPIIKKGD